MRALRTAAAGIHRVHPLLRLGRSPGGAARSPCNNIRVTSASPLPRYQQSLAAATAGQMRYQRQDRRWVAAKILLFLVLVAASLAVIHYTPQFSWTLALPFAALLVT